MARRLAIVMGRNYTSRLGMIRAAGEAGCDVAVIQTDRDGGNGRKPVDACSKYVTAGYFRSPMPDTERLIALLKERFEGNATKPVLLPTDDYTASAVDLNLDQLRDGFLFPGIHGEAGRTVYHMDKAVQKALAQKAGFDVARGWTATWSNGSYAIPEDVTFPCFVKPEISFKGANKQSMKRCESRAELEAAVSAFEGLKDYPLLIEKYVDIEREYAVLGYSDPDTVVVPALITMELSDLGVMSRGIVNPIEVCEGLSDKLSRLMKHIGFTGLFDVDLYESEGMLYFNELNLRFGASGYAVLKSGVNLPGFFIHRIANLDWAGNTSIEGTRVFNNEKVLLQMLQKEKLSNREYVDLINRADFSFIQDAADPKPYTAFIKEKRIVEIKLLVKKILHLH